MPVQGFSQLLRDLARQDEYPVGTGDKENTQAPDDFGWSNLRVGTSRGASPVRPVDGHEVHAKRSDEE
eukprot:scaffold103229_cov17-Prasinocladus_malaysianus.AAC.1